MDVVVVTCRSAVGAVVVIRNGDGVVRGAATGDGVVEGRGDATGNDVGGGRGGVVVPTGAETGVCTGAADDATLSPLLSMHVPLESMPTQSPTKRFEQSK